MCGRGTGHCDVLRMFQAQTQLRRPEKTRHSHNAVIEGRRFLPLHIPTLHTHTRQYNCTIKQNLHNKNSTKSNRMQFI